ncbi:MAG: transglycosylase domain-containing protein, partial [Thermoanaerobaculia bacterium]
MATRRLSRRGLIFRSISIAIILTLAGIALLGLYIYRQSVGKFEIRRLSLPTRIFADYSPLKPGLAIQADDLLEKLSRLGYRETQKVAQSGDYAAKKSSIDIFTRAFTHPTGKYDAQPIRISFKNSAIDAVVSVRDGHPIENAALEPELLTSILSDELENRRPVSLDQVPQHLQDAVIVTEDVRFWHHPGVDPVGIL